MRPEGGEEFAFYGEFLEIVPNEKIVQTETFAPFPDDASTNTMTLTERDGVTVHAHPGPAPDREARDMHINSGMEGGMQTRSTASSGSRSRSSDRARLARGAVRAAPRAHGGA
jgi:uncharacterized protein YndB with AHSA1/START domain